MPKNIELVINPFIMYEYYGDYSFEKNSSELKYINYHGVCLGDNSIALYGSKGNIYFAYCCSSIQNEENEYNFAIKVDYILNFKDRDIRDEQLERIGNLGGLKNYLKKLNIDVNLKDEQIIRDKDKYLAGIFLKFQEEYNNDIFNQENSGINIINKSWYDWIFFYSDAAEEIFTSINIS